jgi:hypothetical protein
MNTLISNNEHLGASIVVDIVVDSTFEALTYPVESQLSLHICRVENNYLMDIFVK